MYHSIFHASHSNYHSTRDIVDQLNTAYLKGCCHLMLIQPWTKGIFHKPISCYWSLSILPESIRRPLVFRSFQALEKEKVAWNGLITLFIAAYHMRDQKQKQSPGVSEAVARSCSVKKMFLEISQNSQENTCTSVSFLIKLYTSGLQLY